MEFPASKEKEKITMNKAFQTILLFFFTYTFAAAQTKIVISPRPEVLFLEQGEKNNYLNFDFLIENTTTDTLTLTKILVTVFNKNNRIIHQRFLDNNGTAPGINTIPNKVFAGPTTKLIFNPFSVFDPDLELNKLAFEFTFTSNQEEEFMAKTIIHPKIYIQKPDYTFPLNGKVLVYDAHDFYAHHRRFDYEFAPFKQLGITTNFMRYAYDFVLLDSVNNQYVGDKEKPESYFGFGKKVNAIAAGTVIYASNNHKDDRSFDVPKMTANPLELYGNCIAVLHKDSSISIYGHLKQNSLKVKTGQHVEAKQELASIGMSGSAFFPHLHFEMRTSITHSAEGLPSYFSNIFILTTEKYIKLKSGLPETGNIIMSK